jgi:hypothetical protein
MNSLPMQHLLENTMYSVNYRIHCDLIVCSFGFANFEFYRYSDRWDSWSYVALPVRKVLAKFGIKVANRELSHIATATIAEVSP